MKKITFYENSNGFPFLSSPSANMSIACKEAGIEEGRVTVGLNRWENYLSISDYVNARARKEGKCEAIVISNASRPFCFCEFDDGRIALINEISAKELKSVIINEDFFDENLFEV
jgi:hypothetical protein